MRTQLAQNVLVRSKTDSSNMIHAVGTEFKDCVLDLSERSRRVAVVRKKFPKALSAVMFDYEDGVALVLTFSSKSIPAHKVSSLVREVAQFLLDEKWVEYAFVDIGEMPIRPQLRIAS